MKKAIKASSYNQSKQQFLKTGKLGANIADDLEQYFDELEELSNSSEYEVSDYISPEDMKILEEAYEILRDTYMYIVNDVGE